MKYSLIFILLLIIGAGCKPKEISGNDLKNKLMETMDEYLHKTLNPGVKFTIKDVIYYPEKMKSLYICQFNVNMRFGIKDTSGIVAATITNDFEKVTRTQ
ncbi:MAG: hypothetical protein ABIO55_05305 [Ginsengibacter sp.]